MSYKALYRKYRPTAFANVLGQDHIVSTLKNIIESDKISHAYLFAGPRGTGKTSVAHVFAKEINRNAAGNIVVNDMDIIEIDAASNNGVAEIRSVIDNARYAPTESKYKVYIIDEVHMLTKGAFNALLKTLEEPPVHVVFILATTEPHKIPVTILSRCQRFNFRRIEDVVIRTQLENVLKAEGVAYDNEAIRFIAKLSQGGMRDALSIADQASAYGNGNISFAAISQVFGIISIDHQINLLNLAFAGNARDLLALSTQFLDGGSDVERLTSSLLDVVRDFIVYKKTNDVSLLEVLTLEEIDKLRITTTYAYEVVEILMKLLSDLRFSQVPRQAFELALLKIAKEVEKQAPVAVSAPAATQTIAIKPITVEIKPEPTPTFEEPIQDVVKSFSVFETAELSAPSLSQTATTSIVEEVVEEAEIARTQVIEEKQDLDATQEIENDILSTQDIPLNELQKHEQHTAEIDLIKMFSISDTGELHVNETHKQAPLVDDILNVLVQATKTQTADYKAKMGNIGRFISNSKYATFSTYMEDARIISAGEGFILFSSENDLVVEQINADKYQQDFIDFTKEVFGTPINAFAITKKQFDEVKQTYMEHSKNGTLPTARPIKQLKASEKQQSEAEKFGSSLFGDLFS